MECVHGNRSTHSYRKQNIVTRARGRRGLNLETFLSEPNNDAVDETSVATIVGTACNAFY